MADAPFVDAHIHFWDKSAEQLEWAWLERGYRFRKWTSDSSIDAPRYATEEFLAEASGTGLAGAVHVHCADPISDPAIETVWLESVAEQTGYPQGIVGACDLHAPDAVATITDQASCSRFRGVRDPASPRRLDAEAAAPAMDALAAVAGSVEVRRHHDEFDAIDAVAARWPSVPVLLSHACLPLERTPEQLAAWRKAMKLLALRPNVACKISTVVGASQPECSVARVRPWVLGCIEAFGADRCMVGSNFPIDRQFCSFRQLIDVYRESIAELSGPERAAVLAGTATRLYALDLPGHVLPAGGSDSQ
jgi:predicted TIM-barrel fold metal-dependent hydrolase